MNAMTARRERFESSIARVSGVIFARHILPRARLVGRTRKPRAPREPRHVTVDA